MLRFAHVSIPIVILLSWAPAQAQFAVSAVAPARHQVGVPCSTPVQAAFTAAVNPGTINPSTVRVFGRWSGKATGTLLVAANGLSFTFVPDRAFFPGETVSVMLAAAVSGAAGGNLVGGHAWSFWTRPAAGSGQFVLTETINVRRSGEGLIATYGGTTNDLNGDGAPDMVMVNEIANDIRTFMNDGCGGYGAPRVFPIPNMSVPSPNEGADFNGDGLFDLVTANVGGGSISVLLGDGGGGYLPHTTYPTGGSPRAVVMLDVEGDGDLDLVTANRNGNNLALFRGNGDGTFQPATFFEGGGTGETGLVAADANNDGWIDLLVGHFGSQRLTAMLSNGNGTFTQSAFVSVGGPVWMMSGGDLDRDGAVDAVTANSSSNNITVVRGNGAGGLLPGTNYPSGSSAISADLGDLDGDGDLDVVVAHYSGNNFVGFRNNGAAVLSNWFNLPSISTGSCALLVDQDRDGDLDVLGVDEVADVVRLFRQSGPSPSGVQPPDCNATLRVNGFADRGGYGGRAAQQVTAGGTVYFGITGPAFTTWSLALSTRMEPGLSTPIGIFNLTFPLGFLYDGLGGDPRAVTDGAGEDVEALPLPLAIPPGVRVALQAIVRDTGAPLGYRLTNPEEVVF
jgi:hypothetical protein